MLVLGRQREESVVITVASRTIRVTVVEIRSWGGKVKLGFEAPDDVVIHRQEVYDAIEREKEGAAP